MWSTTILLVMRKKKPGRFFRPGLSLHSLVVDRGLSAPPEELPESELAEAAEPREPRPPELE
jgi:hypothetical protein